MYLENLMTWDAFSITNPLVPALSSLEDKTINIFDHVRYDKVGPIYKLLCEFVY